MGGAHAHTQTHAFRLCAARTHFFGSSSSRRRRNQESSLIYLTPLPHRRESKHAPEAAECEKRDRCESVSTESCHLETLDLKRPLFLPPHLRSSESTGACCHWFPGTLGGKTCGLSPGHGEALIGNRIFPAYALFWIMVSLIYLVYCLLFIYLFIYLYNKASYHYIYHFMDLLI